MSVLGISKERVQIFVFLGINIIGVGGVVFLFVYLFLFSSDLILHLRNGNKTLAMSYCN